MGFRGFMSIIGKSIGMWIVFNLLLAVIVLLLVFAQYMEWIGWFPIADITARIEQFISIPYFLGLVAVVVWILALLMGHSVTLDENTCPSCKAKWVMKKTAEQEFIRDYQSIEKNPVDGSLTYYLNTDYWQYWACEKCGEQTRQRQTLREKTGQT